MNKNVILSSIAIIFLFTNCRSSKLKDEQIQISIPQDSSMQNLSIEKCAFLYLENQDGNSAAQITAVNGSRKINQQKKDENDYYVVPSGSELKIQITIHTAKEIPASSKTEQTESNFKVEWQSKKSSSETTSIAFSCPPLEMGAKYKICISANSISILNAKDGSNFYNVKR